MRALVPALLVVVAGLALGTSATSAGPATASPPACEGAADAPPAGRPPADAARLGELGRALFFDESLSASGRVACASCHDPRHTFDNDGDDSVDKRPTGGDGRAELATVADDCGRFRTPSLRNVAVRGVFFHNGVVRSLDDAVRFCASRDTEPARWWPAGGRFDDLPSVYRGNVNVEPPFGRRAGDPPVLTEAEILGSLTDADLAAPAPR